MAKILTPIQDFLTPLGKLAAQHPEIEAEVIWANGAEWAAQDDTAEMLDAEEITFYAEGLLIEGFHLHWQVLADSAHPATPVQVRLFFWQGDGPAMPLPEHGITIVAFGIWPG